MYFHFSHRFCLFFGIVVLQRIASEYGLELVLKQDFADVYAQYKVCGAVYE